MATPTPAPVNPSDLPLLPVSTQALMEFDQSIDRQLDDLVKRFGGRERELLLDTRRGWQSPRPNKPR